MKKVTEFSVRLKNERNRLGWTQQELAKEVHLTMQTISSYELGTKYPGLDSIIAISEKLNVSIDYLCGEDKPKIKTESLYEAVQFLDCLNDYLTCETLVEELAYPNSTVEDVMLNNDNEFPNARFVTNIKIYNLCLSKYILKKERMQKLLETKVINKDMYDSWHNSEVVKLKEIPLGNGEMKCSLNELHTQSF